MWEVFLKQYGKMKIEALIEAAYNTDGIVYPPKQFVLNAYQLTPEDNVKVVILGQDPYILEGQAHGLAFSIYDEKAKVPPTLKNIFKELAIEYGETRTDTNLSDWANQGVFLLNTILTVEAGKSLSHKHIGWEDFTAATIEYLNEQKRPICYILLGNDAKKYRKMITNESAYVIEAPHPSPLAAYRGFFESNIFTKTNEWLQENGYEPIKWL